MKVILIRHRTSPLGLYFGIPVDLFGLESTTELETKVQNPWRRVILLDKPYFCRAYKKPNYRDFVAPEHI